MVDEIVSAFGKIDVVDVHRSECMAVACATLGPFIRPSGRGDYASVFRPLLICHADMEVGGGVDFAFEALLEERGLEFGKILRESYGPRTFAERVSDPLPTFLWA